MGESFCSQAGKRREWGVWSERGPGGRVLGLGRGECKDLCEASFSVGVGSTEFRVLSFEDILGMREAGRFNAVFVWDTVILEVVVRKVDGRVELFAVSGGRRSSALEVAKLQGACRNRQGWWFGDVSSAFGSKYRLS